MLRKIQRSGAVITLFIISAAFALTMANAPPAEAINKAHALRGLNEGDQVQLHWRNPKEQTGDWHIRIYRRDLDSSDNIRIYCKFDHTARPTTATDKSFANNAHSPCGSSDGNQWLTDTNTPADATLQQTGLKNNHRYVYNIGVYSGEIDAADSAPLSGHTSYYRANMWGMGDWSKGKSYRTYGLRVKRVSDGGVRLNWKSHSTYNVVGQRIWTKKVGKPWEMHSDIADKTQTPRTTLYAEDDFTGRRAFRVQTLYDDGGTTKAGWHSRYAEVR